MRIIQTLSYASVIVLLAGCMGAQQHAEATQAAMTGERMTLGNVQKSIRKGMNQTEVLEAMGSPNIVTTGEGGNETWVYDKVATDTVHSESNSWWFILVGGGAPLGGGAIGGLPGGGGNVSSGAASQSQRTLTVIIKFDKNKQVQDLAYHSSQF